MLRWPEQGGAEPWFSCQMSRHNPGTPSWLPAGRAVALSLALLVAPDQRVGDRLHIGCILRSGPLGPSVPCGWSMMSHCFENGFQCLPFLRKAKVNRSTTSWTSANSREVNKMLSAQSKTKVFPNNGTSMSQSHSPASSSAMTVRTTRPKHHGDSTPPCRMLVGIRNSGMVGIPEHTASALTNRLFLPSPLKF